MRDIGDECVALYERLRPHLHVVVGMNRGRYAGPRNGFPHCVKFGKPPKPQLHATFKEFLKAYELNYVMTDQFI